VLLSLSTRTLHKPYGPTRISELPNTPLFNDHSIRPAINPSHPFNLSRNPNNRNSSPNNQRSSRAMTSFHPRHNSPTDWMITVMEVKQASDNSQASINRSRGTSTIFHL